MKNGIIRVLVMAVALMLILGLALAEVRTTGNVWLRTGPGLDYDAVSILSSGKSFEYLGESSVDERGVAWYRIIAGEKEGWVSSRYTELIGESAKAEDEAEAAEARSSLRPPRRRPARTRYSPACCSAAILPKRKTMKRPKRRARMNP